VIIFPTVNKLIVVVALIAIACVLAFGGKLWSNRVADKTELESRISAANSAALPALGASEYSGVHEITRAELDACVSKGRPLSRDEQAQLDRGCPGLVSLYQGLGIKKWPESAPGTRSYLRLEDALRRQCRNDQENFIFLKQAWWTGGKPPTPDPETGEVPRSAITHEKVGWYTFNYAVYFPTSRTYAWINHREYGFPLNLVRPQKAYLSLSPPPLEQGRIAQVYCSTCR
jgi:hypothetical protein